MPSKQDAPDGTQVYPLKCIFRCEWKMEGSHQQQQRRMRRRQSLRCCCCSHCCASRHFRASRCCHHSSGPTAAGGVPSTALSGRRLRQQPRRCHLLPHALDQIQDNAAWTSSHDSDSSIVQGKCGRDIQYVQLSASIAGPEEQFCRLQVTPDAAAAAAAAAEPPSLPSSLLPHLSSQRSSLRPARQSTHTETQETPSNAECCLYGQATGCQQVMNPGVATLFMSAPGLVI